MPVAVSGSFVRGDYSGRAFSVAAIPNRFMDASSNPTASYIYNRFMDSSSVPYTTKRDRSSGEEGVAGYLKGMAFGAPTSFDGQGSFGRHMQYGLNKEVTLGNPGAPSLRLDYPGFWRFRWVVKPGSRTISIFANQNSTGSLYRPTLVVKANSNVNINTDLTAVAPAGAGWVSIGPISFTATGTDVVWVEMHNNNINMVNINGSLVSTPAYFDHIVVT